MRLKILCIILFVEGVSVADFLRDDGFYLEGDSLNDWQTSVLLSKLISK